MDEQLLMEVGTEFYIEAAPTKISTCLWYMEKLLGQRMESSWWLVYLKEIVVN